MSSKMKALPLAVAQLIAAGAFSTLAVTPAVAQAPTQKFERIDVTGTNIRRTDTETPSEVQVITQQQMIESGYSSVSEVLRNLTANNNGTLSTGFARAFAAGASGVSLRGLGVGAKRIQRAPAETARSSSRAPRPATKPRSVSPGSVHA